MNHTTGPPRGPNNELVRQLFITYQSALRAYLYRRVRSRAEAEELAQEVYLRLLRVPDMTVILNPEAYLYTIAGNLVKQYAVQQSRGGTSVPPEDPGAQERLSETPSFAQEMDKEQRIERLGEVLPQLSAKCLTVLVLRFWHGLSYEEIAQRLEISTHMVKKYLSQALAHCRRRMGRLR
ncbi:MAG TPA: sigma-70 family RNA polymerase sigma factor [Steroidobacteraceae bacterium]|nr:sigma-70 family RNA polymerase sigma factor [Steroidobacteraceae bacterium]